MSMHARRTRRWTGLVLSMGLLAVAPLAWAAAPQPAAAQAQGVNGYELPSPRCRRWWTRPVRPRCTCRHAATWPR